MPKRGDGFIEEDFEGRGPVGAGKGVHGLGADGVGARRAGEEEEGKAEGGLNVQPPTFNVQAVRAGPKAFPKPAPRSTPAGLVQQPVSFRAPPERISRVSP